MIIAIDLDETLTKSEIHWEKYLKAEPDEEAIREVQKLFRQKHTVVIYTARPNKDRQVTMQWLRENGVPYSFLRFDKLRADIYIDNHSVRMEEVKDDPTILGRIR